MADGNFGHDSADSARRRRKSDATPEPVDFRRPPRPTGERLHAIERTQARLGSRVQSCIANYFRRLFAVDAQPVEVHQFDLFVAAHSAKDWMVPLAANNGQRALLVFDEPLQSHLISRFLGDGPPKEEAEEPPAAEAPPIEIGVVSRAVLKPLLQSVVREVNIVLGDAAEERFVVDESRAGVSPGRMLRSGDAVVLLAFRVAEGKKQGTFGLLVEMRSLIQRLRLDTEAPTTRTATPEAQAKLEQVVRGLDVPVTVGLGSASNDLQEFMRLTPGDVLVLDRRLGQPLDVAVGGKVLFEGQPGRSVGRLAVRLTGRAEHDARKERS